MRTRLTWAAYGVLATLAGIGVAHLVAALTVADTSPVLAVGSTVIDLTPTPMKDWAIEHFGTKDKTVLVGSVMAGVLVLAGVAGLVARRRTRYGAGLLVLLVAIAAGGVLTRPQASVLDLGPSVVAAAVAVAALVWLAREQASVSTDEAAGGRRGLLIAAGVLGALAVGGG